MGLSSKLEMLFSCPRRTTRRTRNFRANGRRYEVLSPSALDQKLFLCHLLTRFVCHAGLHTISNHGFSAMMPPKRSNKLWRRTLWYEANIKQMSCRIVFMRRPHAVTKDEHSRQITIYLQLYRAPSINLRVVLTGL